MSQTNREKKNAKNWLSYELGELTQSLGEVSDVEWANEHTVNRMLGGMGSWQDGLRRRAFASVAHTMMHVLEEWEDMPTRLKLPRRSIFMFDHNVMHAGAAWDRECEGQSMTIGEEHAKKLLGVDMEVELAKKAEGLGWDVNDTECGVQFTFRLCIRGFCYVVPQGGPFVGSKVLEPVHHFAPHRYKDVKLHLERMDWSSSKDDVRGKVQRMFEHTYTNGTKEYLGALGIPTAEDGFGVGSDLFEEWRHASLIKHGPTAALLENFITEAEMYTLSKHALDIFMGNKKDVLSPMNTNPDRLRWYAVPKEKEWEAATMPIVKRIEDVLNEGKDGGNKLSVAKQRASAHVGLLYTLEGCQDQHPHVDEYDGAGVSFLFPVLGHGQVNVWHHVLEGVGTHPH